MRSGSILFVIFIGLLLAAIIHIAALLFAPQLARLDVWTAVVKPLPHFTALPVTHASWEPAWRPSWGQENLTATEANDNQPSVVMRGLDPVFGHAICHFHLRSGPVHIYTSAPLEFWTVNLFGKGGISFFSTNEQITAGRPPDLLVATPQQLTSLRLDNTPILNSMRIVETTEQDGALLLRAYQRYGRALPTQAAEMAESVSCAPLQAATG